MLTWATNSETNGTVSASQVGTTGTASSGGYYTDRLSNADYRYGVGYTGGDEGHTHTLSSHTHTTNVLPPYIAVYVWQRTA